jgi:hypothetical protein
VARAEKKWNTFRAVVRKHDGRRPLRGPRHRRCNNIEMALKEIGWGSMDWIHLSQDAITIIIIIIYLLNAIEFSLDGSFSYTSTDNNNNNNNNNNNTGNSYAVVNTLKNFADHKIGRIS